MDLLQTFCEITIGKVYWPAPMHSSYSHFQSQFYRYNFANLLNKPYKMIHMWIWKCHKAFNIAEKLLHRVLFNLFSPYLYKQWYSKIAFYGILRQTVVYYLNDVSATGFLLISAVTTSQNNNKSSLICTQEYKIILSLLLLDSAKYVWACWIVTYVKWLSTHFIIFFYSESYLSGSNIQSYDFV